RGTALLLDETALEEGQLNALGVRSLQALQNLMNVQKLPYDFQFYQMEHEVDHPVMIFSES
ncbi:unnamed protein product, partial [Heterosigma akashiwo]